LTDISLDNVFKSYPLTPKKWAVEDLSLTVEQGEFFCLVGPSGCGKTTLLKLIAGIDQPTAGQINKPASLAMVFQSGALLPWLSVFENVAFGLKMKGLPKSEIREDAEHYLKMVNLKGFDKKYPRQVSGGQRQRVGIARALAVKPQVLLLDEPFSALDELTTSELHKDLLKIWEKTKITIIMVSHLLEEAVFLADKVGVMKEGKLKMVIQTNSPRPRNIRSPQFFQEVDKLRSLMD